MPMLFANPLEMEKVRLLGAKFAHHSMRFVSRQAEDLHLAYSIATCDGSPCLYVFNVSDKGFVVVSGEDCVKPILGYSTEGTFDALNIADGLGFMFETYRYEIRHIREHNIEATADIVGEWSRLASDGSIRSARRSGRTSFARNGLAPKQLL